MRIKLVALNAQYVHTSLALRLLAAAAPEADCYEGHINLPHRQLLENIARGEPEAIGFCVYIWNAAEVWRLCRALRAALPHVILFAGGPEVAYTPEETLRAHPALDYVLSGEGEIVLPGFLAALADGALDGCPGVTRRDGAAIRRCPPPPPMPPEDWPDIWAGGLAGLERRILYIETARGCPYRCAYCLSSEAGAVRALEAGEALRRLIHMADCGAKLVKLVDRTFNFDEPRAMAIWQGLIAYARRAGTYPTYHFEISAHLLSEAALRLIESAPDQLFQFEAGIQTTDPRALRAIRRSVPFERLRDPLRRLALASNAHLHVDLIAGLPGETPQSFARSFDDAYSLGAQRLQLGFLKVLPGCAIAREAAEAGIAYEPDAPYEVLATREMPFAALCLLKDVERVLDWYGNSGRYALTMRYLLRAKSPWAFYEGLAKDYRARGAFDREQGEKMRATLLLDFCDEAAATLLRHDLLCAGLRRELPDALAFAEDEELRAVLRGRFHPIRGQSAARCAYDPIEFERTGELRQAPCVVLYDPPRAFYA